MTSILGFLRLQKKERIWIDLPKNTESLLLWRTKWKCPSLGMGVDCAQVFVHAGVEFEEKI